MSTTGRQALDELSRVHSCRRALSSLLLPSGDLAVVDRDELAMLLTYLDEQEHELILQLEVQFTRK
jgi:hypothetical protein